MDINLGNIYWLQLEESVAHPYVVIRLSSLTADVCALTTNQNKSNMPGNVILDFGEGDLEKQSIVEVSKVARVNKSYLTKFVGKLSEERVEEILKGIRFLKTTYFENRGIIQT